VKEKVMKQKKCLMQVLADLINLKIQFSCMMLKLHVRQPDQMRMQHIYEDLSSTATFH
jgi:hypothetical protein